MASPLDEARARLDAIDRDLLTLLAERARITRELTEWKRSAELPLRDPEREAQMVAARRAQAQALGLDPWLAEAVTRAVLASNRGLCDEDIAAFTSR